MYIPGCSLPRHVILVSVTGLSWQHSQSFVDLSVFRIPALSLTARARLKRASYTSILNKVFRTARILVAKRSERHCFYQHCRCLHSLRTNFHFVSLPTNTELQFSVSVSFNAVSCRAAPAVLNSGRQLLLLLATTTDGIASTSLPSVRSEHLLDAFSNRLAHSWMCYTPNCFRSDNFLPHHALGTCLKRIPGPTS